MYDPYLQSWCRFRTPAQPFSVVNAGSEGKAHSNVFELTLVCVVTCGLADHTWIICKRYGNNNNNRLQMRCCLPLSLPDLTNTCIAIMPSVVPGWEKGKGQLTFSSTMCQPALAAQNPNLYYEMNWGVIIDASWGQSVKLKSPFSNLKALIQHGRISKQI